MKRTISVILASVTAVSVLASCGKKESTGSINMVDGKYVPTDELSIDIWYTQGTDFVGGNKISDNVVADWLHDKTKVTVNNMYGNDGGQWDTKLSRLVTGNNMPHVITCGAGQGPTHFAKLASADLVWEITDEMLEKYAPNVLKKIPKSTIEKFKINGKLYGIPYQLPNNEETRGDLSDEDYNYILEYMNNQNPDVKPDLYIRDDILKKIYPESKSWQEIVDLYNETQAPIADELFDVPIKTTQEFLDFMYKIKEMGLKENGKDIYSFGYSGGDNWEALVYLGAPMMGYNTHYYTSSWNPVTKEIRLPLVEDTIKQAAKYQNKMILDKVIDPESIIQTPAMYKEKVLRGQYAVCVPEYVDGNAEAINKSLEEQGISFRYRPLMLQIPNLPEYAPGKSESLWTQSITFCKTLSEAQFVQMLNWINTSFSDEFEEILWWGPKEAGLYTDNADGTRTYTDERFNERFLSNNKSALADEETKGISVSGTVGEWYCTAVNYTKWRPEVYNKSAKIALYTAIKRYRPDSEHLKIAEYPPCNAWAPEYAGINDVVKYWAERETWENAFKLAFAASSQEEFDVKWQAAIDTLNSIVNVDEMTKQMTEAARGLISE